MPSAPRMPARSTGNQTKVNATILSPPSVGGFAKAAELKPCLGFCRDMPSVSTFSLDLGCPARAFTSPHAQRELGQLS